MADLALIIQSAPPIAWYRGARPSGVDLAWPRLISISEMRASLRIDGGETPNARAVIDNGDGRMVAQLADPPLQCAAIIQRDDETLFTGIITRIDLGATISITLEA
jgi:hypothetical protein